MSAREFKMPFGKYKGETLEEIYVENVGYLEWLYNQLTKPTTATAIENPLPSLIQQCFKEMRNVRICK